MDLNGQLISLATLPDIKPSVPAEHEVDGPESWSDHGGEKHMQNV